LQLQQQLLRQRLGGASPLPSVFHATVLLLLRLYLLPCVLLLLDPYALSYASVAPAAGQQPMLRVVCVLLLPVLLRPIELLAAAPLLPYCAPTQELCLLQLLPLLVLRPLQHLQVQALHQRSLLHAATQRTSAPAKQVGTTPQQLALQSCSLLLTLAWLQLSPAGH
jgi:hypothetical protein